MDINGYLAYTNEPWGRLFYRLIWHNLEFTDRKILDFGSGFGISANHFAEFNQVTAVEPNFEILKYRITDNNYDQLIGSIDKLKDFEPGTFDVILCHNVLEYIEDRGRLISEFHRLLKNNGILSIVKHNKVGKVMHKAIFDNNFEDTISLLNGKNALSQNFGTINDYEIEDIKEYINRRFILDKTYGIRTFYGLQHNSFKYEPDWEEKMFQLECAVEDDPTYRNIAFFNHLIFKNIDKAT